MSGDIEKDKEKDSEKEKEKCQTTEAALVESVVMFILPPVEKVPPWPETVPRHLFKRR